MIDTAFHVAYSVTPCPQGDDPDDPTVNYHIDWPDGRNLDCLTRDYATAVEWAEGEIRERGFVPYLAS